MKETKTTSAYVPNDGVNSPGTFTSKSTSVSDDTGRQIPLGQEKMSPERINTSPNPAPTTEQIDDPSYGDTVVKPSMQSQEEKPKKKRSKQ